MIPLFALLSAGFVGGIILLVVGLRGTTEPEQPKAVDPLGRDRLSFRLALAVALGLGVFLLSRWPVFAVGAAVFGWSAPSLIGSNSQARASIARVEAIATWVENIRDTMAGGARGLAQAIIATAPMAPGPIAREVQELAGRISAREPIETALRTFAAELGDPSADHVVIALLMVADPRQRFGGVGDALSELATSTRDRVKMRLRVEVGQARMRNSARFMILWTMGFILFQLMFTRDYLQPYSSFSGQLVLLGVAVLFGLGLLWLGRMARQTLPDRFLGQAPSPTQQEAAR